ncbi:hypothetical protein H9X98_19280 [Aeromonas jandaei]|uniref:hypothetical protein n=1 Tax=Aeromonas jandaei TaxID=650 RepID=UPI001C04E916|nr:hypothetical protein [Aeromonas jandaei]MBW3804320.1 hypothetical protein [Aeromonas jandaei]MCF7719811.1 hypothetical protein [Aeromonas jandaei]QWL64837.1 hypothetical protein HQ398_00570 [Aeromonas jandaei]
MRTLTLMAASLLLAACSTPEQHLVGSDRDSHGCIGSAGYQWSALTGKCVRLFEQGIRLNPTDTSQTSSAFVLFNTDQSKAELTLPTGEQHQLARQGMEGNWSWQGSGYTLFPWKGYVLKSGDKVLYQGE